MTRIYIIRHAEAEGNLYRRVQGWYDSLVTENGYRQITALAQRFQHEHIDAVYSSDLFRTKTTAMAICTPHHLELVTRRSLREVGMGVWEDRPWGDIAIHDGESLLLFDQSSPDWKTEGGESFPEVMERMKNAILQVARNHPGQTVAVFSHGAAIRCLQGALRNLRPEELKHLGHCDNTGVTCVEVGWEQCNIIFENDSSHLPKEITTLSRQKWWKDKNGSLADPVLWFRSLNMDTESGRYFEARKDAWEDIHGSLRNFDGTGFLEDARKQWEHDPKSVVCAMLGEEPVGILQMDLQRGEEKGFGYIPFVYMDRAHRKKGLGVQLIGQAVSTFRPLGRQYLRLRCAPDNEVAQRFYHKYGFTKIGEEQGSRVPLDILQKYIGFEYDH